MRQQRAGLCGVCRQPVDESGSGELASTTDGDLLLIWLRLLGWRIELEQDKAIWIGFARQILGRQEIRVRTRAPSRSQARVELFEAAIELGATGSRNLDLTAAELV